METIVEAGMGIARAGVAWGVPRSAKLCLSGERDNGESVEGGNGGRQRKAEVEGWERKMVDLPHGLRLSGGVQSCNLCASRAASSARMRPFSLPERRGFALFLLAPRTTEQLAAGLSLVAMKNTKRAQSKRKQAIGLPKGQVGCGSGYGQPRRRWDDTCKWCKGAGVVMGLRAWEPCACREVVDDEPAIEESAPALMHGLIEQSFPSVRVWRELWRNEEIRGAVRVLVCRIFSGNAMSTRAGWLARCLAWGESGPSAKVGPSRDAVLHSHAILGL